MNTHSSTVRRVRVVAVLVGTALLATVVIAAVAAAAANGAILPTAPAAAPTQTSSTMADNGGTPTNADGYVADGETVSPFGGSHAAVTRLDPALRDAVQDAAKAAKEAGVSFGVASGWRSPAYQAWLLDAAVQQYGSKEAAARWVGTPENSLHVAGKAVDIGPYDAADWLDRKGAAFGLCRTYENEKWHFELFPSAVDEGCPAMYADPSQDPRMSR
ncbi:MULTISPECIES: M15 family metallopeptidase [Bacteria]|uniref:M15 family metallopeptidase n=1 Tax=Bacteria TaxID=2 RepID=UPI003C79CBF9